MYTQCECTMYTQYKLHNFFGTMYTQYECGIHIIYILYTDTDADADMLRVLPTEDIPIQGKRPPLCMILEPTRHGSQVNCVGDGYQGFTGLRFQSWISGWDSFKVLVVAQAFVTQYCDVYIYIYIQPSLILSAEAGQHLGMECI